MTTVRRYMGSTEFARWQINGAALPPSWHEAMEPLARNARAH